MKKTISLSLDLIENTKPELMLFYFGVIQMAWLVARIPYSKFFPALLPLLLVVSGNLQRKPRTT